MQKTTVISAICALAISSYASELGTIKVESSTIDVNTDVKTEISNVNIIDEETIKTVGPKNLTDILKTIPGMTAVSRAGEMMQIRFRGLGNQQYMGENPGVAIIVDGVPVKAKAGGIRINLADIKNIKVIKGSASYLYGDGALSGALIITTKKPRAKNEMILSAEFGSYGYKESSAGITQSLGDFVMNLNASKRMSDGYWRDSETWTKSFNGKLSYYIDDTSDITLGVDITDKYDEAGSRSVVSGVTAAETNPRGVPNDSYTKDSGVDLNKYFLTYSKDFDNMNLNITAYNYEDWYDSTSNPQDLDNNPDTLNEYVSHSDTDLTQQGVKSEFSIDSESYASLLGLEFGQIDDESDSQTLADYTAYDSRKRKDIAHYDGETSYTNSKDTTYAVYGEFKYNITTDLTATVNARYDVLKKEYITEKDDYNGTVWSEQVTSESSTFRNTSYRLGASYALTPNTSLFASVSTAFQNPEAKDLAEDPTLKEQKSINYEVGARGGQDIVDTRFNYELSVFQLDNKDILGPVGGTYNFSDPKDNIGDSRSRGLELSLSSDRAKTLSFNLAYTYLDAKYTKHNPFRIMLGRSYTSYDVDIVGNSLPRVSKHTANLFVNYKVIPDLEFITNVYAKSDYYADEAESVKFNGYALLNLQVRYNTKVYEDDLELFAKVDNVLDNQYYRAAFIHSDKRGNPDGSADGLITDEDASITVDPGRVFYAGINYKF
jgi:iron complex outermembrane recepter protein